MINGKPTWIEEIDPEFVRQLQQGDPAMGWEGDPQLFIRKNLHTGGWTLWRLEDDNVERAVCHSKPNAAGKHVADKSLFLRLMEHDTRRGDVFAKLHAKNAAVQKEKDTKEYEAHYEKLDKVYFALAKDVGHMY